MMQGVSANSDKESGMTLKNNFQKSLYRGLAALLAAGVLLLGAGAQATTVVSPNGQAAVEGDGNNYYPFGTGGVGVHSQRYQQVYLASDFAALSPGGEFITQIAFRPDTTFGSAFSTILPDERIDLSTISVGPDALSATFASNVGANDTIVYGGATGASLSLSSSFTGPAGGPKDFDIIINLTTPFFYNPAAGNLLLDVRHFSGAFTTFFDAQSTIGDSVSRVFSNPFESVNVAVGETDSIGLITKFTTTAAPEPGTMVLFGVGAIFLGLRRRWIPA
jgi:hypothetical protein